MDKRKENRNNIDLQDLKLWQEFTSGVMPIKKSKPISQVKKSPKKIEVKSSPIQIDVEANLKTLQRSEVRVIEGTDFMDKKSLRRLHKGEMKIDRTLDLHGYKEGEAFDALFKMLHAAYQNSEKLVLVITGKGTQDNPSILKYKLPYWLAHEKIAPLIIRFCKAPKQHGGEGAVYVMIKTRREK